MARLERGGRGGKGYCEIDLLGIDLLGTVESRSIVLLIFRECFGEDGNLRVERVRFIFVRLRLCSPISRSGVGIVFEYVVAVTRVSSSAPHFAIGHMFRVSLSHHISKLAIV